MACHRRDTGALRHRPHSSEPQDGQSLLPALSNSLFIPGRCLYDTYVTIFSMCLAMKKSEKNAFEIANAAVSCLCNEAGTQSHQQIGLQGSSSGP